MHWTGDCVVPTDGLDAIEKRKKIPVPAGNGTAVVQAVGLREIQKYQGAAETIKDKVMVKLSLYFS
jgi:hypothetical protein